MVHKIKMKTKCKRRSKICTYRMNETNPKTYRYLLKKEGMPSGASPSLDAWVSLNIYLGCLGHPQAWALASPHSSHINTSSILENLFLTKLNRIFISEVSTYKSKSTYVPLFTLLYNYNQTFPTVYYHYSMAPKSTGHNKNSKHKQTKKL